MLTDYQIGSMDQAKWPLVAIFIMMIGYVAAAVGSSRARGRLLMGLSGLVVLIAYAFALGMAPLTTSHSALGFVVFLIFTALLLVAVVMDIAPMSPPNRPTWIDFLQFLFLSSVPWVWFVGVMTIGHQWL